MDGIPIKVRIAYAKEMQHYLTLGKVYAATREPTCPGQMFNILSDIGEPLVCLFGGCAHLGFGDWEIVEDPQE